jgi:hypothetical protein
MKEIRSALYNYLQKDRRKSHFNSYKKRKEASENGSKHIIMKRDAITAIPSLREYCFGYNLPFLLSLQKKKKKRVEVISDPTTRKQPSI